jgi:hypothetical protein
MWDETIRSRIADSQIALVLVSRALLDTKYVTEVEIPALLDQGVVIVPVLLSPCEWQRHEWVSGRQHLPGKGETVEEHYRDGGRRKGLFLQIREELRRRVEEIRRASPWLAAGNPFTHTLAIKDPACFIGRAAELERLHSLLQGGSVALVGEPKIGKSSLLHRLAATWQGTLVGPLDFDAFEDRADLLARLAEELQLQGSAANWRGLRQVLRQRALVLLLDELDAAPTRGFGNDSLAGFRAVCNVNPEFRLVVASRRFPKTIFPDDGSTGSPAYNFLQPLTLGPMHETEIRTLLAHPWSRAAATLDEPAVERIVTVAAGHPFKAQRGAYHRYQALVGRDHDWQATWRLDLEQML